MTLLSGKQQFFLSMCFSWYYVCGGEEKKTSKLLKWLWTPSVFGDSLSNVSFPARKELEIHGFYHTFITQTLHVSHHLSTLVLAPGAAMISLCIFFHASTLYRCIPGNGVIQGEAKLWGKDWNIKSEKLYWLFPCSDCIAIITTRLYLISLLPVSLSGWSSMFDSAWFGLTLTVTGNAEVITAPIRAKIRNNRSEPPFFQELLLSATAPQLLCTKRLNYRSAQFVLLVSWNPLAKWENSCTPMCQPWH